MNSDFNRYKEYLQRILLTPDWQKFAEQNDRADSESFLEYLAKYTQHGINVSGLAERLASDRDAQSPNTSFDQVDISENFYPLLRRIEKAARSSGLTLNRPVELATSTEGMPGPVARNVAGRHVIFVGAGTGKFANGFAGAYTDTAHHLWQAGHEHVPPPQALWDLGLKTPGIMSYAFMLARHYAQHGSIVTAPMLPAVYEQLHIAHRSLIIDAMELFVLSHEYGHCLAEEKIETTISALPESESRDLEFSCDQVGLKISRAASAEPVNMFAYSGTGATLFLRAIQLCEAVRQIYLAGKLEEVSSPSHPSVTERLIAIRRFIDQTTPPDDKPLTLQIFDYYDDLACAMNTTIVNLIIGLVEKGKLGDLGDAVTQKSRKPH